MGAWGLHSFDNDTAQDFLAELADMEQPVDRAEHVIEALTAPFRFTVEDIDADAAMEAVAGAEIVAAALDHPRKGEAADTFELKASFKFYADAVGRALAVLERIRHEDCELAELWADTEEAEDWHACITELQDRLRSAAADHDLDPEFTPPDPDESPEKEVRDAAAVVYQEMMQAIEQVAESGAGDPQVEMLRHFARKLHLVHMDIGNMRYDIVDSLERLADRVERLEKGSS
ncbi:MAG: DUF4259 domain-containing protein [Pseudomonadota bacterium]